MNNKIIEDAIKSWIENIVIGLNLCPFAHDLWKENRWKIKTSNGINNQDRFKDTIEAVKDFIEKKDSTLFLVFSEAKENFIRFYNFSALIEEEIKQMGLQDQIQIVTFHPEFRFEGEKKSARGNFVNRSPYPLLHFLWTDEVSRVIEKHGQNIGEKVAYDNNQKLLSLSESEFEEKVLKFTHSLWQVEDNE